MKFVSGLLACMLWGAEAVSEEMTPQCDGRGGSCDGDSEDFALLSLKRSAIIMNRSKDGQHQPHTCGMRPGMNSRGTNLHSQPYRASDASECCSLCESEPRCTHWTRVHVNNQCWLKDGSPDWKEDHGVVDSGEMTPRWCHPYYDRNSNGNNLHSQPYWASSIPECCRHCESESRCDHWTWVQSNGQCWLKGGSPTWTKEPGVISGEW